LIFSHPVNGIEIRLGQKLLSLGHSGLRNNLKERTGTDFHKTSEIKIELLELPSAILEETDTAPRRI